MSVSTLIFFAKNRAVPVKVELRFYNITFFRFYRSLFLCICLITSYVEAQELNLPETMTFSYVNHPVIINHVVPIVRKAYKRLGIKVEFILQPSARNLRQASAGVTDGDTAYSDMLVRSYPNLMLVGPEFFESVFVLLCHRSEICNEEVLFDAEKMLVLTDASRSGIETKFGDRLEIKTYSINSLRRIPRLLDGRRLKYGIYVTAQGDTSLDDFPDLTVVELFRTKTFHVLNDKYSNLVPIVSEALEHALKESSATPE